MPDLTTPPELAQDGGLSPRTGSSLLESAKTAIGLEKLHRSVVKITGDQWPEIVAEQSPLIKGLMEKMGTNNPLSAACEVIKSIPPHDQARQLIVAVAVQMTLDGKNVEHVHHHQRGRASITGLGL